MNAAAGVIALGLALACPPVAHGVSVPASDPPGEVSVRAFGARGDGTHDDTAAFRRAIAAVAASGGVVRVPSHGPGKGYVITGTLRIPAGVALIGSPAGFANNGWAAFAMPERILVGSKILARPTPDQYSGPRKRPLFEMPGGSTVRGLYILYDRQPWPTDEEFADPRSRFHCASFADAKKRFIAEHVKPYGPTFYVTGPNAVIEDIVCDRYYDFFVQARGGRTYVDRISLYGYRTGFAYLECLDVNRLSRVHLVPNVGPACPGKPLPGKTYTWIYGIVASNPSNVGVHVGRSDGYVFSDLMFFGVHTALRLGASKEYPLRDPVAGAEAHAGSVGGAQAGFSLPYHAQGPWGSVNGLMADLCAIGIHMVWPTPLTNRMTNVTVHTGIRDGREFAALEDRAASRARPDAPRDSIPIGAQAAVLVEPSHVTANDIGLVPALFLSNLSVGSFTDTERFADGAGDAARANGRVFLIGGDIAIEVTNVQINSPYTEAMTVALGPATSRASLRMRGVVRTGVAQKDYELVR